MILILTAIGCGELPPTERSGTAVGNPGTIGATASEVPEAIALEVATLTVFNIVLDACDGSDELIEPWGPVDLLAPNELAALPGGSWCGLSLETEDLVLEGLTDGGTDFSITLTPQTLLLDLDFSIDGDALLVELPLPLDVEGLEALGEQVALEADAPLAAALADDLQQTAALWLDDGDGLLTSADQEAMGIPHLSAGTADESSGCATAPAPSGWLVGLLLMLLGRRQRSGRHQR